MPIGGAARLAGWLAAALIAASAAAPEFPTVAESGLPGYEAVSWYGVLAPAGTPREIVARLNGEMVRKSGAKAD